MSETLRDREIVLAGGAGGLGSAAAAMMIEGSFEVNLGDSEVLGMFKAMLGRGYTASEKACV